MSRGGWAWLAGIGGTAVVTGTCLLLGDHIDTTVTALFLLVPVIVSSVVGGWQRSIIVSFVAALTYSLAFLPPIGRVHIGLTRDVFALITFEMVAIVIGVLGSRRVAEADATPEARDLVLRAVSHDLRNPLSTIRAASTDLLSGAHTDEARRTELLGLVVTESERLDRIVGNLLSVGRVQAGTLVPRAAPESLDELIERSAARMRRMVRAPIVVDVEPGLPDVVVDAVQLDQVLANLVENAARVSPPAAPIRIDARRRRDAVVVDVTDAGPGFPPARREDAFEAFRSSQGSSGIGLAVCKAVVEAHGGTIEILGATHRAAPGATVRFSLPLG